MHYFVAVLAGAASVAAQVVSAPAAANTALQTALPRASGTSALRAVQTIRAGQSFDCGMKLYDRSRKKPLAQHFRKRHSAQHMYF